MDLEPADNVVGRLAQVAENMGLWKGDHLFERSSPEMLRHLATSLQKDDAKSLMNAASNIEAVDYAWKPCTFVHEPAQYPIAYTTPIRVGVDGEGNTSIKGSTNRYISKNSNLTHFS